MRLLYAWLAALGVVVAGLIVDAAVALVLAGRVSNWPEGPAQVLLVHVPWTLTLLAAAVVASRICPASVGMAQRLLAALLVPALFSVGSVAAGAATGAVALGMVSAVEAAGGGFLGWLLMHRLANRGDEGGYFPA